MTELETPLPTGSIDLKKKPEAFEGGRHKIRKPKVAKLRDLREPKRFRNLEDSGEHHKKAWEAWRAGAPDVGARRP